MVVSKVFNRKFRSPGISNVNFLVAVQTSALQFARPRKFGSELTAGLRSSDPDFPRALKAPIRTLRGPWTFGSELCVANPKIAGPRKFGSELTVGFGSSEGGICLMTNVSFYLLCLARST